MDITALQHHVVASDIQPERLAGNSQLTQREKIGEASRQFESILLKQILENSQKTVIKSKYSDNSTSASIYHDMVTTQLADSISKSGGLGLAKTFEQQLDRRLSAASMAGNEPTATASPTSRAEVAADRPKIGDETTHTRGRDSTAPLHRSTHLHLQRP